MQVQFQITADELKEFQHAHLNALRGGAGPSSTPMLRRVRRGVGLVMLAGVGAMYVNSMNGANAGSGLTSLFISLLPWLLILLVVWFFFVHQSNARYIYQTAKTGEKVSGESGWASVAGWVFILSVFVLIYVLYHDSAPVHTRRAAPGGAPSVARPVSPEQWLSAAVPWVIAGAVVTMVIWRMRQRAATSRGEMAAKMGYQTIELTQETVTVTTAYSRTEHQWLAFTRFCESANLFVLYLGDNLGHVIPKRAFASPADADEFRALATANIQPMTHGFPVELAGAGEAGQRQEQGPT